ncbi:MAG: SOUL family heme-binding protein [Bacillota bacterium]
MMAVEKASYKVIIKDRNFEVRLYDPMIVAVSRENDLKGTSGFNQLFNYISGRNRESRKIAMTAPVINNLDNEESAIAFVMPKEYSLEELPQPLHSELQFKQIPERYIAAITFSGNINKEIIEKKKHELVEWLKEKQITVIGSTELARYNPPFIPGFIKHNELLVEVNSPA